MNDAEPRFPCQPNCGACCYWTHLVPDFPYKRTNQGACEMLAEDRTCRVYETRPEICRTRVETNHDETAAMCGELMPLVGVKMSAALQAMADRWSAR